jgi:uncharacterized protein (TIGR03067 family)
MNKPIALTLAAAVVACFLSNPVWSQEGKLKTSDAKALVGSWTINKEAGQTFPHILAKFGLEGGDTRGLWNVKFTDTEIELTLVFPNGNAGLQKVSNLGHGWVTPETAGKETKVLWRYKYTLDLTASPHTVDLTPQNLGEVISPVLQGKPLKGIWKIENGSLHLCYADAGQDRPGKFLGWESRVPDTIAYLIFDRQSGSAKGVKVKVLEL